MHFIWSFAVALGVSKYSVWVFFGIWRPNNSVGSGGFVAGNESIAYGDWTTAVGYRNISAGAAEIANFRFACEAYGVGRVALGDSNVVNANLAQAFGGYNTIGADFSSAIGSSTCPSWRTFKKLLVQVL